MFVNILLQRELRENYRYTIENVDKSDYGITVNWRRSTSIETRTFFNFFNTFVLIANIILYLTIMAELLLQYKQRNKVQVIVPTVIDGTPKERGRSAINEIRSLGASDKIHGKVRRTLLISSFVNWIISLVGK
ncbi:unnamed protein product [Toxocara canis]|uniref:Uncharacterized protein n=1 Tax=Toxocara canis TaxID=6265 RepID=A0A183U5G7_TOXCA|nr:unnamed protein product [Toxocara canis]